MRESDKGRLWKITASVAKVGSGKSNISEWGRCDVQPLSDFLRGFVGRRFRSGLWRKGFPN
jgi:hypothetical protein